MAGRYGAATVRRMAGRYGAARVRRMADRRATSADRRATSADRRDASTGRRREPGGPTRAGCIDADERLGQGLGKRQVAQDLDRERGRRGPEHRRHERRRALDAVPMLAVVEAVVTA